MADKVQENRIRRMAERQGMKIEKSRRRDPLALDFDKFSLTDASGQAVTFGEGPSAKFGTADQVEAYLKGEGRR